MSVTIESLEGRTLFSAAGIAQVSGDYDNVLNDATVLKTTVAATYTTYKAELKTITADIKALPKSKTNTADIASLKKTITTAGGLDTRDAAKLITVGKASLNKAKSAFFALEKKAPTTASEAKLDAALAALGVVLSAPEATLISDAGVGSTDISAALNVLVAANPTDTKLSADVTTAEGEQSSGLDSVSGELSTLSTDLTTLIDAIG